MKRTVLTVIAAFLMAVLPAFSAVYAKEPDAILAERVESDQIRPGDKIVIVNDSANTAVSVRPSSRRLAGAPVTVAQTKAGRKVLTAMDLDTAVCEVIEAGEGDILLKCETAGYLTSAAAGNGLYWAEAPEECGRWQFREGQFLYNPNAKSTSYGKTYTNFYLEVYNGTYTTYGKTGKSDTALFEFSFYRMGNSDPGDPVVTDSFYYLPVFETSDTHGYLADTSSEPYRYLLAYISDKVKDVRGYGEGARNDLAVLLDGGDIYQGNTLSNLMDGQPLASAYQIMGYDAVTVGNHEFDWGIGKTVDADGTMMDAELENIASVNTVPVVISNLYLNGEKVPFAEDYIILNKTAIDAEGRELPVRIAVIGFAGEYSSSIKFERFTGAGFTIETDYDALNKLASELESSGKCDATVLLTHEEASDIAACVGGNSAIDLVLGGHTHRNLSGTTEWGLPYLEPASYGAAYAYAELAFSSENGSARFEKVDKASNVSVESARAVNTPGNREDLDPEVTEVTDRVLEALDAILNQKIGYITESATRYVYLPGSGKRSTASGNWHASIIARIGGADIGFVNNGGLRADVVIEEGQDRRDVTLSDIHTLFPFDNRIYCYELTYGDLLAALEYSLTENGRTLLSQIWGIDVYYTDTTVNAIVTKQGLAVYANGAWREGWKDKTVLVALSDFIATTDRVSYGMSNPFVAWNDTPRLLHSDRIDSEGAYAVLAEEAEKNGGHLAVDLAPHYIESAYTGSVDGLLPPPFAVSDLTDAQKPTGRSGLTETGREQELIVPPAGPLPEDYAVMYSADGGRTWTDAVPSAKEAGEYSIQVRYVSRIYEAVELGEIKAAILPNPAGGTSGNPPFGSTPPLWEYPFGSHFVAQNPKPESEKTALPFEDVGPDLYDTVRFVYENGIMNGVSDTAFDPDGTLTRGMIVTILYRLEGEPAAPYSGTFTDVPEGEWYAPGVEWAARNGVVNGYGGCKYGPEDPVTREQLAAILWRYAEFRGLPVSVGEDMNFLSYNDVFDIAEYAKLPMFWALETGVISDRDGDLDPGSPALRREVAAAMTAFCGNAAK